MTCSWLFFSSFSSVYSLRVLVWLFLGPCSFYDLWLGGGPVSLPPLAQLLHLFVVALAPCSWLCLPRAMDYTKLKETWKVLKQHAESLETRLFNWSYARQIGRTRLNFKSSCGGFKGDSVISEKRTSAVEAKLAKLQQTVVYLVNQQKIGSGILASSSTTEHWILRGKVSVRQANMNAAPAKEVSTLGWSF